MAPVTAAHIFRLLALGAYTGNHVFRVDRGFVAQVAEVTSGRSADWPPLTSKQNVRALRGARCQGGGQPPAVSTPCALKPAAAQP